MCSQKYCQLIYVTTFKNRQNNGQQVDENNKVIKIC